MLFASSLLDSFVPTGLVSLFVAYPGLASGAAFFCRFAAGGVRCGLVRFLVGVRGAGWDSRFLTAAPRRFGMTKF